MTLTVPASGPAHPSGPGQDATPGPGAAIPDGRPGTTSRLRRLLPSWPVLVLAALAYIPLLATSPGRVGADTKAYLYLDPGRMMARVSSMWDPDVGMGTVTHQNIGYLFPQGLFYWLAEIAGLPDWVAQRLWTGSILFGAGTGVLFLLRTFRWPDRYAFIAALGYMLTPYTLEYEARISAILLPYAGLGWFIGITVRGLREAGVDELARDPGTPRLVRWRSGWRWPAAFALMVTLVGSINASSLIFILVAPMLWVPFAVWGTREVRLGTALTLSARTAVLILVTSAWWIVGLYTQAGYGLNVLSYSETVKTVASSSQASEVLRGLGNWFFYGQDALGPWIEPATDYTGNLVVMAISFAVPILALAAAGCVRWGHRAYFVALITLGTTISVGVYPYDNPSPFGRLFRAIAEGSTAGLALRSMPRAVPMVALGLSVLLAGGLAVLDQRLAARRALPAPVPAASGAPRTSSASWLRPSAAGTLAFGGVALLLVLNMSPLYRGHFIEPLLDRPEDLPSYEQELASALDAVPPDATGEQTRVLELPGSDFFHYRWGTVLDPVTHGLMDRAEVVRELIPYGDASSVDLLRALDRRLQEGVLDPASIPGIARLMSAGDVVLRSNLAYERFRTPRPRATWDLIAGQRPAGLSEPRTFGPPVLEDPGIPYTDEITLGTDSEVVDPPALADFTVADPHSIVRAQSTRAPLLVSGNGEALVDAAATGQLAPVLDGGRTILYAGSLAGQPDRLRQALNDGAELLVSDTNRLRAERWTGLRENFGYVEQPGVTPLADDVNDNRLEVFPEAGHASETIMQTHAPGTEAQVENVRASDYGNTFSYGVSDRPVGAIDGDLQSAWRVGAFKDPTGDDWQVELAKSTTTDHIRVVQPINGPRNRWITRLTLTFDGGAPVTVDLRDSSRTEIGQTITFPRRTFTTLRVHIDGTNFGEQREYDGLSGVGLAEVEIPGVDGKPMTAEEVLRLPTDTLDAAGADSLEHRLSLQMSRDRANPAEPFRSDPESTLRRTFTIPTPRAFALTGTARVSAYAGDQMIDATLGRAGAAPVVTSSGRLPGDLDARGSSAFDGDPSTAWSPGFGEQADTWVQVSTPTPVTFSSMNLALVADGRHSVPTRIGIVVDGRRVGAVDVPPVTDTPVSSGTRDATRTVALSFPAVTGNTIRLVVEEVRTVTSKDTISGLITNLPVGIAEIAVPGLDGSAGGTGRREAATTAPGAAGTPGATASAANGTITAQPAATAQAGPPGLAAAGPQDIPAPCRTDLMTLDGAPVGLQITGSIRNATDRHGLEVRTCGTPVTLSAGDHVVRTANGALTGLDIDRLLLASEAGGGAWLDATGVNAITGEASGTTGGTSAGAGTGLPTLKVEATSDTSFRVDVTGATPGTPFWLVLGQSRSAGWKADVDGRDLGESRLIDAYANGWRVSPTSGSFTIDIDWVPQRTVERVLRASVAAGLLTAVVLFAGTYRRRRGRTWRDLDLAPAGGVAGLGGAAGSAPGLTAAPVRVSSAPPPRAELPTAEPWRGGTVTTSVRSAILLALATGAVSVVLVSPVAGLVVALLTGAAARVPRARLVLRAAPAVCLAVSALYVLQAQARHDLPADGSWVSSFDRVATLSWLAVLLLAAEAVLTVATRRRASS